MQEPASLLFFFIFFSFFSFFVCLYLLLQFSVISLVLVQIFYHLGMAWGLRWAPPSEKIETSPGMQKVFSEPIIPTMDQVLNFTNFSPKISVFVG